MIEHSLQFWQLILGAIGLIVAAFVAFFTGRSVHFQKRQMKETLPKITQIKANNFRKDNYLDITIVNCKPHSIALEDIKYKKRFRLPQKAD